MAQHPGRKTNIQAVRKHQFYPPYKGRHCLPTLHRLGLAPEGPELCLSWLDVERAAAGQTPPPSRDISQPRPRKLLHTTRHARAYTCACNCFCQWLKFGKLYLEGCNLIVTCLHIDMEYQLPSCCLKKKASMIMQCVSVWTTVEACAWPPMLSRLSLLSLQCPAHCGRANFQLPTNSRPMLPALSELVRQ